MTARSLTKLADLNWKISKLTGFKLLLAIQVITEATANRKITSKKVASRKRASKESKQEVQIRKSQQEISESSFVMKY